jgi:hypothetical protein
MAGVQEIESQHKHYIASHKQSHVLLTEKVLDFQRSFKSSHVAMGVEIMQ